MNLSLDSILNVGLVTNWRQSGNSLWGKGEGREVTRLFFFYFFKREAALWIPVFFFFLFVTVIVAKLKLKSANLKVK